MPDTLHIDLSDDEPGSLSFEVSGHERLSVECDEGGVRIFANKRACSVLAHIFGKLAVRSYEPGFHLHVRTDFNDDAATPDALTVILARDDD